MPASVVLVQQDPVGVALSAAAIRRAGHDVASFCIPTKFLDAMDAAKPGRMRVLVTDLTFPADEPHGVAIALIAMHKRPAVRVAFTVEARFAPDIAEHAAGIGEIVEPHPVRVLEAVRRLIA